MKWSDKMQMIRLRNNIHEFNDELKFYNFCLSKMPEFDGQALDIFMNLINITNEDINKNIKYWLQVYYELHGKEFDMTDMDEKARQKFAIFETAIDDHLIF